MTLHEVHSAELKRQFKLNN